MSPTPDVLPPLPEPDRETNGDVFGHTNEPLFTADQMRDYALAALSHAPAPVPPSNDEVICPSCCHQFRAIPVNVQRLMLDAGFEPPFTDPPAVEETMTAERIDRIAELVVKGMPDGISGFCKTWGWQQFARALLDICPPDVEKPAARIESAKPARHLPPAEGDWEEAVAINPSDIRKIHAEPAAGQQATLIDVEELLADVLPGGDVCDPQQVADNIRAWFAVHRIAPKTKE